MAAQVDEHATDPEVEDALNTIIDILDALPRGKRRPALEELVEDLRGRYADDLPDPTLPQPRTHAEREGFARHEAGHAVVAWHLGMRPWLAWIQGEDGRIPADVLDADDYRRKDTIYDGKAPAGGIVKPLNRGPWSRTDPPRATWSADAAVAFAGALAQVIDERLTEGMDLGGIRRVLLDPAELDHVLADRYSRGAGADVRHAAALEELLARVGAVEGVRTWTVEQGQRAVTILTEPANWDRVDRLTAELLRIGVVGEAALGRILGVPDSGPTE